METLTLNGECRRARRYGSTANVCIFLIVIISLMKTRFRFHSRVWKNLAIVRNTFPHHF